MKKQAASTTLVRNTRNNIKENKAKVVKLEAENYDSIILWRSDHDWWKMCGHSALIYAYKVAPEALNKTDVIIHLDTDSYYRDHDGTVSLRENNHFVQKFKDAGLELSVDEPGFRIFTLPKKFRVTEMDIDAWRKEEAGNYAKVNEVLATTVHDQDLENLLRKIIEINFNIVKKFPDPQKDFVGEHLYEATVELFNIKSNFNRDVIPEEKAYRAFQKNLNAIADYFCLAMDLKFISASRISGVAQHLRDARLLVEKKIESFDSDSENVEN